MWLVTSLPYCTSDFPCVWLANSLPPSLFPEFLSLFRNPAFPLMPRYWPFRSSINQSECALAEIHPHGRTKRWFHNKLVTLPLPPSAGIGDVNPSPGLQFLFSSLFEALWVTEPLYKFKVHVLNCWDYASSQETPADTVLSLSWLWELPSSSLQPPLIPSQPPDTRSSLYLEIGLFFINTYAKVKIYRV